MSIYIRLCGNKNKHRNRSGSYVLKRVGDTGGTGPIFRRVEGVIEGCHSPDFF